MSYMLEKYGITKTGLIIFLSLIIFFVFPLILFSQSNKNKSIENILKNIISIEGAETERVPQPIKTKQYPSNVEISGNRKKC